MRYNIILTNVMNGTKFYSLLLFTVFGCLFSGCTQSEKALDDSIRIGVVVSLAGPAAQNGENWLSGVRLAAKELEAAGVKLNLYIEDDRTEPARAVSAFQKVVNANKVHAVMGGTWDFLGEAMYPLAERHEVPLLTPTNPAELVDRGARENRWIFSNGLTIKAEQEAIGEFIQVSQVETTALIYPNLLWGISHAEIFDRLSPQLNFEIVYRNSFPYEGYHDAVRIAAYRVGELKPDLVYAPIDASGLDILTAELQRLRLSPFILASQHLETAYQLSSDDARYSRVFGVHPRVENAEFAASYQEMFGKIPPVYSEAGYDGLMFLVKAIQTGVDFSERSSDFKYEGVTGLHTFSETGSGLVDNRAQIVHVKDGRLEVFHTGATSTPSQTTNDE